MKIKLPTYLSFACVFVFSLFVLKLQAQLNYQSNMQEAQQRLASAKTENDFNSISDVYAKIARHEKNNWLPYYYAGLSKALAAITLKNKNADALCNDADIYIKKADSINPSNSEVMVLKSLNYSARLNVNPKARAMKYNKHINQANETALKLNVQNPRAYLQKAQAVYYAPEAFGGGAKKALPLFELALDKFNSFKLESALMPKWGKDIAEKMITDCKTKIGKVNK